VGVEVDEELGREECGEEGVDGVEGVRKRLHGWRNALPQAGIQHIIVLGRDDVDDEVLPRARGAESGKRT
jgi:hypothetical protein